jgi:hypothetical protein
MDGQKTRRIWDSCWKRLKKRTRMQPPSAFQKQEDYCSKNLIDEGTMSFAKQPQFENSHNSFATMAYAGGEDPMAEAGPPRKRTRGKAILWRLHAPPPCSNDTLFSPLESLCHVQNLRRTKGNI